MSSAVPVQHESHFAVLLAPCCLPVAAHLPLYVPMSPNFYPQTLVYRPPLPEVVSVVSCLLTRAMRPLICTVACTGTAACLQHGQLLCQLFVIMIAFGPCLRIGPFSMQHAGVASGLMSFPSTRTAHVRAGVQTWVACGGHIIAQNHQLRCLWCACGCVSCLVDHWVTRQSAHCLSAIDRAAATLHAPCAC